MSLPKGQPVFSFLATVGNHMDFDHIPSDRMHLYQSPQSYREHYANSIYLSDKHLETFIEELKKRGRYKNSIIVITGDHSIPSGDHGITNNEIGYYEESFRVPFLLLWPDKIKPQRIRDVAYSQLDIAPTIIDLLNRPIGDHPFQGQSIFQKTAKEHPIYLVQPYNGVYLSVLNYPLRYFKHISDNREYVYDLQKDPQETQNIKNEISSHTLDEFRVQLSTILKTTKLMKANQIIR